MKRLLLIAAMIALVMAVQAQPEIQFEIKYSGHGNVTSNIENPYEVQGIVSHVVDGDTIDANITIGNDKVPAGNVIRVRMADINCHEIKGPQSDKMGRLASEYTTKRLLNQTIWLDLDDMGETDFYGRWIAVVYLDGRNFNQELANLHYADIDDYKDNEFDPTEW